MGVSSRITHMVINAHKTEKAPERHSSVLLAGIQKNAGFRVTPGMKNGGNLLLLIE
jgi:hypothetical protein